MILSGYWNQHVSLIPLALELINLLSYSTFAVLQHSTSVYNPFLNKFFLIQFQTGHLFLIGTLPETDGIMEKVSKLKKVQNLMNWVGRGKSVYECMINCQKM